MKKCYTEGQIIEFLKEVEREMPVVELCKKHGFSEESYYKWKSRYGGIAKQMKALEEENKKLKKRLKQCLAETEETDTNKKPTEYEDRICAFIDILGFRKIVDKKTNENGWEPSENSWHPSKVIETFLAIKYQGLISGLVCSFAYPKRGSLQVVYFSDSIVIFIKYVADDSFSFVESLKAMFLYVNALLEKAGKQGILLRGGIARGKMIHDGEYAFGPVFNRAYELEQQAVYPRIILDSEITDYLESHKTGFNLPYIHTDFDGWKYVRYPGLLTSPKTDGYEVLKKLVNEYKNSADPSIRTKYMWLEKKLEEIKNIYENHID